MALRHENLIRFLLDTTSPGETIQYIPNPGNAGDSLIKLGTLQLMDSLGLRVKLHNHKESFGKKIASSLEAAGTLCLTTRHAVNLFSATLTCSSSCCYPTQSKNRAMC